jgi:hypothetical protein
MEDAMTEERDITQRIIDYEQGELGDYETIVLFADLIKTGLAWQLQGSYGRTAQRFIESGVINRRGEIDWDAYDALIGE